MSQFWSLETAKPVHNGRAKGREVRLRGTRTSLADAELGMSGEAGIQRVYGVFFDLSDHRPMYSPRCESGSHSILPFSGPELEDPDAQGPVLWRGECR